MQTRSCRIPIDADLRMALATFCILPFFAGCAVGQPGGPLDFDLPPDQAPLLLLVLVAAAVVVIWNRKRHNPIPPAVSADPALSLLRDRYARGDIDRDEFLLRRHDLEEQRIGEARGANTR